jgi:hypothetical protein
MSEYYYCKLSFKKEKMENPQLFKKHERMSKNISETLVSTRLKILYLNHESIHNIPI